LPKSTWKIIFKGLYKRCECGDCDTLVHIVDKAYRFVKFTHGHQSVGRNAYNYKGYSKASEGRLYVVRKHHPNADSRGRILRYRYEMELELGRYLEGDEEVHHIIPVSKGGSDEIENLRLYSDHKQHLRIEHGPIDTSNRFCYICGSKKTTKRTNGRPDWYYGPNETFKCRNCYERQRKKLNSTST